MCKKIKVDISFMMRRGLMARAFLPEVKRATSTNGVRAPAGTKTKVFGRFTCTGSNGVFSEAQGGNCGQHVCRLADRLNGILNVDRGLERATVDSVNGSGPARAPGRPKLSV